ncbi:MAG: hypothetical protein JWQ35_755, partial [Bacteriovoracaceae bacterium]|nr:hypothetical protein [Bacteriovoracaceae bacterium]
PLEIGRRSSAMVRFSSYIFVGLLLSFAARGQTYVLNPYHEKNTPTSIPLSEKNERQWLQTFYQKVKIQVPLDRMQIKDENGESLDQKIKLATQNYLELNQAQALDLTQEALGLLSQSPPYSNIANDFIDIAALKLMIHSSTKGDAIGLDEISEEIRPLLKKRTFDEKLPLKIQAHIRALQMPLTSKILSLPIETDSNTRFFILGEEIRLPKDLEIGRYLVYLLNKSNLEAYWLDVEVAGKSTAQKIWSRPLWKSIPAKEVRESLEAAKPASLPRGGISVLIKEANEASIQLVSDPYFAKKPVKKVETFKDPFETAALEKDETTPSILKSPWFWLGVGVVTGGASYFIYDSTQTKIARTP